MIIQNDKIVLAVYHLRDIDEIVSKLRSTKQRRYTVV